MNIVLIGAQGSGKGTQARRLAQALGICYVASGDLFRKEIAEATENWFPMILQYLWYWSALWKRIVSEGYY